MGHHMFAAIGVLTLLAMAPALPGATVYNTGVNDLGVPLPAGATDPHYWWSTDGLTWTAAVVARGANQAEAALYGVPEGWPLLPGTWYLGIPNAAWIAPQADVVNMSTPGDDPGRQELGFVSYLYRIQFDLMHTGVTINGRWTLDNYSLGIFLNTDPVQILAGETAGRIPGSQIVQDPQNPPFPFQQAYSFTIGPSDGLVVGTNYLYFSVVNSPDTAPNPTGMMAELNLVPEPATYVLIGGGLLVLALRRQYRSR